MAKIRAGLSSLAVTHPEIAAEWDTERNGGLDPSMISAGSGKLVWWKCSQGHEWKTAVYHRKEGHGCLHCANSKSAVKAGKNDLATLEPEIAKEWDDEKNKDRKPTMITKYSQMKVWWKCSKGHSYQASPAKRVFGRGCPYCSNQKVLSGYNDLATVRPDLALEWDHEKNGDLHPTDVTAGADKKVWWRCRKGHSWESIIYSRKAGTGCPYCAGNILVPRVNDLQTEYPDLTLEWDWEKNKGCLPFEVASGSSRRVWWKCTEGHSWNAVVSLRTSGKGCPYCSGRKVLSGFNDLATKNPELAIQWDYEKNEGKNPSEFTPFSSEQVWWLGRCGHSWSTQIKYRSSGSDCPYCSGRKVLVGFNDLGTMIPELAAEWDYESNKGLTPEEVTTGSNKKIWWVCKNGHRWRTAVVTRQKTGCPYCSNRKVWIGYNDLETIHPELAKEWDHDKNKNLKPCGVTFRTIKKIWWICEEGHSYLSTVYSRHKGTGCPICAKKINRHIVVPGVNDLASQHPRLIAEWDQDRNGDLTPDRVMSFSTKKVWWVCEQGHHWRARIQARRKGTGCPFCKGRMKYRSKITT